jgi:hypothetical protein
LEVQAAVPQKVIPELGRGGQQHKSIQERLQREANKLGFTASVESQLAQGSTAAADLVLQKGDWAMAVEISVTTTTDHEFGNIKKCLAVGFVRIAVVSPSPERLKAIALAVHSGLDAETRAKVGFYAVDELITELHRLSQLEDRPEPKPRVVAGWKVRREGPALSATEKKTKEGAAIHIIAEAMKARP